MPIKIQQQLQQQLQQLTSKPIPIEKVNEEDPAIVPITIRNIDIHCCDTTTQSI